MTTTAIFIVSGARNPTQETALEPPAPQPEAAVRGEPGGHARRAVWRPSASRARRRGLRPRRGTDHPAWPGYAPTPLVALDGLARACGVASILYKDEGGPLSGPRGGFKALGGAPTP
ncbi:hypothetical protein ACTMU2_20725 [Cupriavidus basilensis]